MKFSGSTPSFSRPNRSEDEEVRRILGENRFGGPIENKFVGALLMKRWIEPPEF